MILSLIFIISGVLIWYVAGNVYPYYFYDYDDDDETRALLKSYVALSNRLLRHLRNLKKLLADRKQDNDDLLVKKLIDDSTSK